VTVPAGRSSPLFPSKTAELKRSAERSEFDHVHLPSLSTGSIIMKTRSFIGIATVGLLICGSAAMAQAPGTIITQEGLELPVEREVIVREYVVREPVQPVIIEGGGTIRPGSVIPDYVRLRPFNDISVPSLRGYAYFISPDEKIVIVDPATRQVLRIISSNVTGSIALAPEQRTRIRQYILRQNPGPITVPPSLTVSIGTTLPESVQVYPLPADVGMSRYGYSVIGNSTVLVDPSSRRIVQVIE
jgi:Protein of unknown function (DUF1236)